MRPNKEKTAPVCGWGSLANATSLTKSFQSQINSVNLKNQVVPSILSDFLLRVGRDDFLHLSTVQKAELLSSLRGR